MKTSSLPLVFLIICTCIIGCSSQDFDRSPLLQNVADNLIVPAYDDFYNQTNVLKSKVYLFTEAPNKQTLADVQSAWKESIKSWKQAELYNFGPIEEKALVTSIDRRPASEAGIEDAIEKLTEVENYLLRIGSNRKGLPAMEYLLFHEEPEVVINRFGDTKRKKYLQLLAESLFEHSQYIVEEWKGGYRNSFVESVGNRPNSGVTLLVNEMGYLLEMVRMDKIEIPFGKQTNGTPRLHMLESPYAHISKVLIKENLLSARHTFTGGSGRGFDDYLNALNIENENGKLLSDLILAEYDQALSTLNGMNGSLREAIQHDKKSVEQLIEHVQKLYIYTEVDMISQLSLLQTFSDNDGD